MRELKILITGAGGFIGVTLCHRLAIEGKVIALDFNKKHEDLSDNLIWEEVDITDLTAIDSVFRRHMPDVVIHCAGIAHQKVGTVSSEEYLRVNSKATEKLAELAAEVNPEAWFLFLSTVSVYGEENYGSAVSEDIGCHPSSDYAVSKCDAERRLVKLFKKGILKGLTILRLAPVYDRCWSLNLDRRVFGPQKMIYLRFGSGEQQMSALSRLNLVDFIEYLLRRPQKYSSAEVINVCDAHSYAFNTIIKIYKTSGMYSYRPVIKVPLPVIWLVTRVAGVVIPGKKDWLHSCYDKLANSMVFDNKKMLTTGFLPRHSLETIFMNS